MRIEKKSANSLAFSALLAVLLILPTAVFAQETLDLPVDEKDIEDYEISTFIRGVSVNGWNRVLGTPAVENLPFVGNLGFAVGGVLNPDGPALPIDNDTPLDALMASYAAPDVYLAFFGVDGAEDVPNQNIPYADYPQIFKHDGTSGPLEQHLETDEWWDYTNGAQTDGYTVGDWLSAFGRITFTCSPTEGNYYQLRLRNMIPGGLYTVWGFYFDTEAGQLQQDFPFGGTSANVFVANHKGNILGTRALSFCPMKIEDDERNQLVNLFVVYHPDGRVNAAVGHTVAEPPFNGPGMTATPQVMFPFPENF